MASSSSCDDGSEPYQPTGEPNWECTIQRCRPNSEWCPTRSEDACYDDYGRECPVEVMATCTGKSSCFMLWLTCTEQWACSDPDWAGCFSGNCGSSVPV